MQTSRGVMFPILDYLITVSQLNSHLEPNTSGHVP